MPPALTLLVLLLLAPPAVVHRGRATTFGPSKSDPNNPNDTLACDLHLRGVRRSVDPRELAVALPSWHAPCGALVLVCLPRTGRCAAARVLDRGPRAAILGRRKKRGDVVRGVRVDPHAIDATRAVQRAVGFDGDEDVVWVVMPDVNLDQNTSTR